MMTILIMSNGNQHLPYKTTFNGSTKLLQIYLCVEQRLQIRMVQFLKFGTSINPLMFNSYYMYHNILQPKILNFSYRVSYMILNITEIQISTSTPCMMAPCARKSVSYVCQCRKHKLVLRILQFPTSVISRL
jgi:hypothetical protein